MYVKFRANLGMTDAHAIKAATGVDVDINECKKGDVVDLPDAAVKWLQKKYAALVEPASRQEKVKAVPPAPMTAPAK